MIIFRNAGVYVLFNRMIEFPSPLDDHSPRIERRLYARLYLVVTERVMEFYVRPPSLCLLILSHQCPNP